MVPMRRFGVWLGAISILLPFLGSCRRAETSAPAASKTTTLLLAAYTTPREAYRDALLPGFETAWKQKSGGAIEFRTSYQGSGAQARAIIGGFEADIAALALAPDIDTDRQGKAHHPRLESAPARRHGLELRRRHRGPQGKSRGNQGLDGPHAQRLERSDSGPEDLRRRHVEHQRDLRRGASRPRRRPGQRPGGGGEVPRERVQERLDHGQGSARVDHDLREGRRRRRDHVRERGPDGPGRRRAARVHRPQVDDPDPEPGRRRGHVRREARHAGGGHRVPRFPGHSRRPAGLRQVRFSSRGSRRREGGRSHVPEGRGSLDDRRSRRLAESPARTSTVPRASGRRSSPTRALRSESGAGIRRGARGPGPGPADFRRRAATSVGTLGTAGDRDRRISGSVSRSRSRR